MRRVWMMAAVVAFGLPLVSVGQQVTPPPPDYQKLLEKSLTREGSMLNMCVQQREDLIAYFQEELRKERRKHEQDVPPPASPANGK